MKVSIKVAGSRAHLTALLEGLVALNGVILDEMRNPPCLYTSGVRYVAEPPGFENWLSLDRVIRAGKGDCEDLAAWRTAELKRVGVDARAVVIRTGPRKFHAVVRWPDGRIEDPSKRLGMGRRARA